MKEKLLKWIKKQRKIITGVEYLTKEEIEMGCGDDENMELDEGQQMQLQLLDELEEFVKVK